MTTEKLSFLELPEQTHSLKNIYLQTDLGILDILGELPAVGTFEEISSRATTMDLQGKKIKLISIDDLIKAKKALGRPKDIATIYELNYIKEKLNLS